jgi:hypothetical protein
MRIKRAILMELIVICLSAFHSSRVSAQALEPPLPPGVNYYDGMIASQTGFGVIGCDGSQAPAANGNGCLNVGTNGPFLSLTGGTLTGPLIGTSSSFQFINGIPQADKYPGVDFCAKLLNAETAALVSGQSLVDASHFTGTVQCASDPFGGLVTAGTLTAGQSANLTVMFPAALIQTSVPWIVNFSGLNVIGLGPYATRVEYIGTPTSNVVSAVGNNSYYIYNFFLSNMFIYGDSGNVTNAALQLTYTHHADIHNVYTWGAARGISTLFAVTDTFYRVRTSTHDANLLGIVGVGHTTPTNGLYFDKDGSGKETTDGTVIDAAAEGLNGTGWVLAGAINMTFTGGTSEGNTTTAGVPGGINVQAGSSFNNFLSPDLEANTSGLDMLNNGTGTYVRNAIMSSGAIPYTEGASGAWTDLEGGSFDTINGTVARWVRFGNQILGSAQLFANDIKNANGTVIPAATRGATGSGGGYVVLGITGLTGSIGGSALAAGACSSGTATVSGATQGHPALATPSDGSFIGGDFAVLAQTTDSSTITVDVCAHIAGTPPAKTYNVITF